MNDKKIISLVLITLFAFIATTTAVSASTMEPDQTFTITNITFIQHGEPADEYYCVITTNNSDVIYMYQADYQLATQDGNYDLVGKNITADINTGVTAGYNDNAKEIYTLKEVNGKPVNN